MSYNTPPNSFHSIDLNLPATFQNINDATTRQRLLDRQEKIIQQTKTDMMANLINGAEANMRDCQTKLDLEMAELWKNYRTKVNDQYLTKSMIELIDERLVNITERFQLIYNYKMKYFFFKAPTVTNNNNNNQQKM
jgi:hypothetical protein